MTLAVPAPAGLPIALDGVTQNTPSTHRPIQRQSLHEALTPSLREMILTGELKVGSKIPERLLCERFGVSRTPLRETLKVLAAEGLVELLPQRGAVVASIKPEDVEELFPIMAELEALAGRLACERASDADIQAVRVAHDQMIDAYRQGDERAYLRLNRVIHESIFAMARNDTLAGMYQNLLIRMHSHRFVARKSADHWRSAVEDHEAIIAALADRNKRRLPTLLRNHINGTTTRIARDALAGTPG